ncbi:MAG: hypothetical protein JWM35_1797, partial [Verrucomicrobia bacterium]|nr:hypothetical protein [Verrucomicrobiota bacterium]
MANPSPVIYPGADGVVLAGGSCESVRLLLNSKSKHSSNGLANSSGRVGKYLMDSVASTVRGQVPLLE